MGWFSEPMVFVLDQAYFSGSSKKTRTFLGQTSTSEDVCVCVRVMDGVELDFCLLVSSFLFVHMFVRSTPSIAGKT